jgi:hypothetical protein
MGATLATMLTMTTYGTWLRGDRRGWVDDGITLPPDPELESADRLRMKYPPFLFARDRLLEIGELIGQSLVARIAAEVYALHVGTWHVHIVVGPTGVHIGDVAKCAKDAVRYGLRAGRPIWSADYDKRFCFDVRTALTRIRYVERHNESMGWGPRPWTFIAQFRAPHLAPGQ